MYLKQFRTVLVRVPDPLRPGKRAFEERQMPTGVTAVSWHGKQIEAEEDGWIDLPDDCAEHLKSIHYPKGERWLNQAETGELVAVGAATEDVERQAKAEPRPKARAKAPQ